MGNILRDSQFLPLDDTSNPYAPKYWTREIAEGQGRDSLLPSAIAECTSCLDNR